MSGDQKSRQSFCCPRKIKLFAPKSINDGKKVATVHVKIATSIGVLMLGEGNVCPHIDVAKYEIMNTVRLKPYSNPISRFIEIPFYFYRPLLADCGHPWDET